MRRTYDSIYHDLYSKYSKYIDDQSYVYKSYRSEWIIVMKLLSDSITDIESKELNNLINGESINAVCKSDKLEFIMIINKFDTDITHNKIYSNDNIEYICGEIMYSKSDDEIKFYRNIMNSYLSEINLNNSNYSLDSNIYKLHGEFYDYYHDGKLHHIYNYYDGKLTSGYVYNYDGGHTHVYSFKRFV